MLIPALDLIDGQIVRLKKGDFNEKTVFNLDPIAKVKEYAQDGAQLIHIVDLDGAKDPKLRQLELIHNIVKNSPCPIQTGGGIRNYDEVKSLLELGVKRVVVGSKAVEDIDFAQQILEDFGSDRICLALDIKLDENNIPRVATQGWREISPLSLYDLLEQYVVYNLQHVLVTDIDKDGMMQGTNVSLYETLAQKYPQLNVIASGGVSSLDDLQKLKAKGASSVVLGRSLLSGAFALKDALKLWQGE